VADIEPSDPAALASAKFLELALEAINHIHAVRIVVVVVTVVDLHGASLDCADNTCG
jgi:hypothetical protein